MAKTIEEQQESESQKGRPKKKASEKKKCRFIYLNDHEYERVKKKALRANLSFSDFAFQSMVQKELIVYDVSYKELLISLKRIGVNVNQIARFWNENSGNLSESEVLKDLKTILSYLSNIKEVATKRSNEV